MAVITWNNVGGDSMWGNPLNWDLEIIPQDGDTATIIDTIYMDSYSIDSGVEVTLGNGGNLTTSDNSIWANNGTLTINSGAEVSNLANYGVLIVGTGGVAYLYGAGSGNWGQINIVGGTCNFFDSLCEVGSSIGLSSSGVLNFDGSSIILASTNCISGDITFGQYSFLGNEAGTGEVLINSGCSLTFDGTFISGTIVIYSGGSAVFGSTFSCDTSYGATLQIESNATVSVNGAVNELNLLANAICSFYGDSYISGMLQTAGGAICNFYDNSSMNGTVTGNGTIQFEKTSLFKTLNGGSLRVASITNTQYPTNLGGGIL